MGSTNLQQGNFEQPDIGSIYHQIWRPRGDIRAVIVLVHGASEHCGRYQQFAEYFTAQGFAVAALDLPGHGRSDGSPGYIRRFDDYLGTLRSFHDRVNKTFRNLPQFLLGHSMGGLVATHYLLDHQNDFIGCALSSALIKTDLKPGALKMAMVKWLSVLMPRVGVMQLDPSGVSRDPDVVEDYINDPLVFHGKGSARMAKELFGAMHKIQSQASRITLPMLIMHGGSDSMTSPTGSRFLHNAVSSEFTELKIYDDLYHEIFNEPEQEQVFDDLLAWFNARLDAASPVEGQ